MNIPIPESTCCTSASIYPWLEKLRQYSRPLQNGIAGLQIPRHAITRRVHCGSVRDELGTFGVGWGGQHSQLTHFMIRRTLLWGKERTSLYLNPHPWLETSQYSRPLQMTVLVHRSQDVQLQEVCPVVASGVDWELLA